VHTHTIYGICIWSTLRAHTMHSGCLAEGGRGRVGGGWNGLSRYGAVPNKALSFSLSLITAPCLLLLLSAFSWPGASDSAPYLCHHYSPALVTLSPIHVKLKPVPAIKFTEKVHGRARAPSRQTRRVAANEVRSRVAPPKGADLFFIVSNGNF
jgi:hypothetical protein